MAPRARAALQRPEAQARSVRHQLQLRVDHDPGAHDLPANLGPHTVAVARRADQMGFEMLVPIARWRGFGGSTDFNGECFETYTWAAGLANETEQIQLFATSHVPTVHPIVAAKMATTVDHISGGRFGLNLVMGWFGPEMEMFGGKQREHDERYRFGDEWLRLVTQLWEREEPFDFDGDFFTIHGAQAHPKPLQQPRP